MTSLPMLMAELLVLFLVPAAVIHLSKRYSFVQNIGTITFCYALGFLFSLLPIPYDKSLSETVASVLVALAIPLILFGSDIRQTRHLTKKALFSFILVIISVLVVSTVTAWVGHRHGMENTPALSGMATGLYIGGTPNLFAIGKAFFGKDSTYINLANIADSIVGSIYFLLLLSVIKTLYSRFLGCGKHDAALEETAADMASDCDFRSLLRSKKDIGKLIGVVLLAAACLGIGVLLEILINGNMDGSLYIMVTVSILGILFSFIRPIRETRGTYSVGQYLILVFSLGLSMSIDLDRLITGILPTLLYFSAIQIFSLSLHFILCKIFKIDGGTAIITGVAGIYGPPFVAPVANAYGDKSLIVPGMICGTLGLIIGNLIGIALGSLLAVFW